MSKVFLTIMCFLFFTNDVLSQGSQIPSLRIYTNNKDKNDPSSFYLPLQYIDSIVHYNIVAPTVITGSAQSITRNSANISAKVTSDGGGTISQTGFCWSTKEEPTINSAVKYSEDLKNLNFSVELLGLSKNTKYFVRAFAINEVGISYGNQVEFTTVNSSDIVIIDGQEYNVITLGEKCFENSQLKVLEENLKVTKYANGDTIRYVRNKDEMMDALNKQEGAYCYYNFDTSFNKVYGKLYNKYALQDSRGLAPLGWRMLEGEQMINAVSQEIGCGGSMKSIGTVETGDGFWLQPNVGATNESGFNGQPGGFVIGNEFKYMGEIGFWWGYRIIPNNSWIGHFSLVNKDDRWFYINSEIYFSWAFGFQINEISFASVRCIKE